MWIRETINSILTKHYNTPNSLSALALAEQYCVSYDKPEDLNNLPSQDAYIQGLLRFLEFALSNSDQKTSDYITNKLLPYCPELSFFINEDATSVVAGKTLIVEAPSTGVASVVHRLSSADLLKVLSQSIHNLFKKKTSEGAVEILKECIGAFSRKGLADIFYQLKEQISKMDVAQSNNAFLMQLSSVVEEKCLPLVDDIISLYKTHVEHAEQLDGQVFTPSLPSSTIASLPLEVKLDEGCFDLFNKITSSEGISPGGADGQVEEPQKAGKSTAQSRVEKEPAPSLGASQGAESRQRARDVVEKYLNFSFCTRRSRGEYISDLLCLEMVLMEKNDDNLYRQAHQRLLQYCNNEQYIQKLWMLLFEHLGLNNVRRSRILVQLLKKCNLPNDPKAVNNLTAALTIAVSAFFVDQENSSDIQGISEKREIFEQLLQLLPESRQKLEIFLRKKLDDVKLDGEGDHYSALHHQPLPVSSSRAGSSTTASRIPSSMVSSLQISPRVFLTSSATSLSSSAFSDLSEEVPAGKASQWSGSATLLLENHKQKPLQDPASQGLLPNQ